MDDLAAPYVRQPGTSEVRWMGKTVTHFLATGDVTGGQFALVEETAARGMSVPLHRHDADVESFYVLDGTITFYLDDSRGERAGAGAFVHVPGGAVHGFRVESDSARYLILTSPHHAEFYRAISVTSPGVPVDGEVVGRACREFGVTFIGPLPKGTEPRGG